MNDETIVMPCEHCARPVLWPRRLVFSGACCSACRPRAAALAVAWCVFGMAALAFAAAAWMAP